MSRRAHIAVWLLALAFAAAPASSHAVEACASCCCEPAPCHDAGDDCDAAELAASPCGGLSQVLPSVREHAPAPPATPLFAAPQAPRLPRVLALAGSIARADLAARTSPLRFSVVRLN